MEEKELIIDLSDCTTEEEILAKIPPEFQEAIADGSIYPIEIGEENGEWHNYEKLTRSSNSLNISYNYNPKPILLVNE